MSIYRLTNLAALKHLSEYTVEELITSFGLYEKAIINLKDVRIPEKVNGFDEYFLVSEDVERLNNLLSPANNIMLPCADCRKEQPFIPQTWWNPRNHQGPYIDKSGISHNIFDFHTPRYQIGENQLNKWNINDANKAKNKNDYDAYISQCVNECKAKLLEHASEVRKDFYCAYINSHHVFVQFRIYDPIEPEDIKESSAVICSEKADDQKAYEAYEYLHDCLIIQKVGQYPSIADMQLFDISKYRTILCKDNYRELTRAVRLYANGIGCGSFVYLRRILERLIDEKRKEYAMADAQNWDQEQYEKQAVNKRIEFLEEKGFVIIPKELQPIKTKLYGVLSKGVHECSDEECSELFPYLKNAIKSILDEQIEQKERKKETNQLLNKISNM